MSDHMQRFTHDGEVLGNPSGSSAEILSFSELERMLSKLWDDDIPEQNPNSGEETSASLFFKEKSDFFQLTSSNIEEAKAGFLLFYGSALNQIDVMAQQMILCVQERQQELKSQLRQIKDSKVSKWDHQISVCNEALTKLKDYDRISTAEAVELFSDLDEAGRELEFLDSGRVKFEIDNFPFLLKNVRNYGTLIHHYRTSISAFCSTLSVVSITPKFIFGSSGGHPGQFCRPWGVCSDSAGRILICDRSNHRVQIFDESGNFLSEFGKEGENPGEFNRPSGIDVVEKRRIVVADKDNHRIQVFTFTGQFLFTFGRQGTRAGQFMYPWDVSVNSHSDIAVSDSKNHRVQLFNKKGYFLALFDYKKIGYNSPHLGLRHFDSPRGLTFRADGSLLVTDFNNHKIVVINPQFTEMTTFGCEGNKVGQFFRPQGIACDSGGRYAVADSKNYRIQVFDELGSVLSCFGNQGNQPGQFDHPLGICFHRNRNIIVVDFNNNRVQVF